MFLFAYPIMNHGYVQAFNNYAQFINYIHLGTASNY